MISEYRKLPSQAPVRCRCSPSQNFLDTVYYFCSGCGQSSLPPSTRPFLLSLAHPLPPLPPCLGIGQYIAWPRRPLLKSLLAEGGWLQSRCRKRLGARAAASSQSSFRSALLPAQSSLVHALQPHPHHPDPFSQTDRFLNPVIWPMESAKSRYPGHRSRSGEPLISIVL